MDVYVERLYAALADALQRGRSRPFSSPVTVAEIYQDLVPYRVVRSDIGFEMNADYEHALIQLLAGAGGLARLEPDEAAEELRAELGSPNPNVGLFRKFAACDVWIVEPAGVVEASPVATAYPTEHERFAPESVDEEERAEARADASPVATAAAPGPESEDDMAEEDVLELQTNEVVDEEAEEAAPAGAASAAAPEGAEAPRCNFCDSALPAGRLVRFCPFCGADQTHHPCGSCGETLETGWRYCVACGASQGA